MMLGLATIAKPSLIALHLNAYISGRCIKSLSISLLSDQTKYLLNFLSVWGFVCGSFVPSSSSLCESLVLNRPPEMVLRTCYII